MPFLMILALALAILVMPTQVAGQPPTTPVSGAIGTSALCSNFSADLLFISLDVGASPGWVWVNKGNPGFPQFRSVSGRVTTSKVTHSDYPDAHDSHDHNIDVRVDPTQEDILSDVGRDEDGDNNPDTLELEWEAGIPTFETSGDGSLGFFPKWAWPVEGDRVWANGDWVFDCGHPKEIDGINHQRTELHPMRAVASMRQQIRTLPGTGTTPVPVTATDLYIHGRSGVVTDILDCGLEVLLGRPHLGSEPELHVLQDSKLPAQQARELRARHPRDEVGPLLEKVGLGLLLFLGGDLGLGRARGLVVHQDLVHQELDGFLLRDAPHRLEGTGLREEESTSVHDREHPLHHWRSHEKGREQDEASRHCPRSDARGSPIPRAVG